jgi:hypothetical protein
LGWPAAQPCEARRAERLGRSGGPTQRRRRGVRQSQAFSQSCLACGLFPRMIRRRLASHARGRRFSLPFTSARFCYRLRRCCDLPTPHFSGSVFDRDSALPSFIHQHFASCRQRRSVSASTCNRSSEAKCSAANVGPNRSPTAPPYFSRTNRKTRCRNFLPYA